MFWRREVSLTLLLGILSWLRLSRPPDVDIDKIESAEKLMKRQSVKLWTGIVETNGELLWTHQWTWHYPCSVQYDCFTVIIPTTVPIHGEVHNHNGQSEKSLKMNNKYYEYYDILTCSLNCTFQLLYNLAPVFNYNFRSMA